MPLQDFLPKKQDAYLKWHDKYLKELKLLPAGFGIAAGEVTQVQDDNDELHAKMAAVVDADAAAKVAHADLNAIITSSQATARGQARRIKPNPAYLPALGEKWASWDRPIRPTSPKPSRNSKAPPSQAAWSR